MTFETKDSGERATLAGGMVRDTQAGKSNVTLVRRGPMLQRWMDLLDRGAVKYHEDNWCQALAETDLAKRDETRIRFAESAARHFEQWLRGDRDEDHAAAVFFNINGFEAMVASEADTDLANRAISFMRHVYERGKTALFVWARKFGDQKIVTTPKRELPL